MARNDKILIVRSGAIGDFIVTLPVIDLLRKAYPGGRLCLMAKGRVRPLVKGIVNEFIDFDGPLLVPFFQEKAGTDCETYRYMDSLDLIISYLGRDGTVSRNLLALKRPRVINADARPPKDYHRHITEFLLEPLAEILDISAPPLPAVPIGENEAEMARNFLGANGIDTSSRLVAVHPGSGGRHKVTPTNRLGCAVIHILERFPQGKVLIVEGEADARQVADFKGHLNAPYVKVNEENLLDVAAILSRASLFVGNDSGIAHLAAAVGVPTIVVFRASNPTIWAPRGEKVWIASEASLQEVVDKVAEEILNSRE